MPRTPPAGATRVPRLGESVVLIDGKRHLAAIVTEILLGAAHLKVIAPRVVPYDELHVPHRKNALPGEDRFWIRVGEE